jgi:Rrf2 family protein
VRITAKADYAVRAAAELAAAEGTGPIKGERIATAQDIPLKFLENILSELRTAGLVASRRGAEGGYWLDRPASEVTVADVLRAVEGPLASIRGTGPERLSYGGAAQALPQMWVALRSSLRIVLEGVTLADLASGELPARVTALADEPDAWVKH